MKVLFVKDVLPTAIAGEVIEVKKGFARNLLFPNELALPATEHNLKLAYNLQKKAVKRRAQIKEDWGTVAKQLEEESFEIVVRSTEKGRLFGSVTSGNITTAIEDKMEITLPKKAVKTSPIRFAGKYKVDVVLHAEVVAQINLVVKSDVDTSTLPEGTEEGAKEVEDKPSSDNQKTESKSDKKVVKGEVSSNADSTDDAVAKEQPK